MSVNDAMDGAHSETSEYGAAEFGSGNDQVVARGDTWQTSRRSAAVLPQ